MSQIKSFITVDTASDFSIHNLPFGIFSTENTQARAGSAIGHYVIDLAQMEKEGFFPMLEPETFSQSTLNKFIAQGQEKWLAVRTTLQSLLSTENNVLRDNQELQNRVLLNQNIATMHLPISIPGYTDFYSSKEHAYNVGCMFRDPNNALLANWSELPVGYNGRASSVVVSGTDVTRPNGQIKLPSEERPIFTACKKLDFELETGFIIGKSSSLGQPISIEEAENHIFGMVLLNDWSARDIQQWEYVPLGPFNAKTFATSISPWIVTMAALKPFKTTAPIQEPKPLTYLQLEDNHNFDIQLEVDIQTPNTTTTITKTNFKYMYWSMAQQLAHHTVSGCNVQIGDVMGSGTISGSDTSSRGSLLELTWNGQQPLKISDNEQRTFLEDGDTLTIRGFCQRGDIRVGFGQVSGKILPALKSSD